MWKKKRIFLTENSVNKFAHTGSTNVKYILYYRTHFAQSKNIFKRRILWKKL